jgi:hypothetical protein
LCIPFQKVKGSRKLRRKRWKELQTIVELFGRQKGRKLAAGSYHIEIVLKTVKIALRQKNQDILKRNFASLSHC